MTDRRADSSTVRCPLRENGFNASYLQEILSSKSGYIPSNEVDVYVPRAHDGSVMCPSGHEVLTAQQLFNERDDDFPATHLTITRICDECHKEIIIEIAY